MRIAVLISGEYRTFGICCKTMKFLDNPNVDIYFSTWNKTVYSAPKINLYAEEDVTIEKIKKDLGKDAIIEIEPHNSFVEKRYNSKMIHRWKRGFELIKRSNILYDYVLIMRPDLFFDVTRIQNTFDFAEKYKDSFAVGWRTPTDTRFLNDIMFFSSYNNMKNLIDSLTIEKWATAENTDWHSWWYTFVSNNFSNIEALTEIDRGTFCRFWADADSKFPEVATMQEDWNHLMILQFCDNVGREKIELTWKPEIIDRAYEKWNTGVYEKYTYHVALIISGMLRNYDTALLSLDIWGKCDRYLVTWESAGQDAINDYTNKAGIKESFIIPDEEFEKVYNDPCKNGNNTFRMVYLWEQAFKHISKDYKKYVIIRPDGFYWAPNKKDVIHSVLSEGPFKTSQTRRPSTKGIDDHVFVIDKTHFYKLENCYSELVNTALEMIRNGTATNIYGDYLNPHELLFNMWKQNIPPSHCGTDIDMCSKKINNCIEALWVRNTFQKLPTDKYDRNLYNAIFYDTAAHWRNSAKCNYHGTLNRI